MPEKLTEREARVQVSASGPTRFGGFIFEEFLPELRFPQAVRVYDEMRKNSAVIGGFLRAIEAAFHSTEWQAVPFDNSPEARARAAFLQQNLHDMDRPWDNVLTDILTVLPFGFAPMEMVFKLREGRNADPPSKFNDHKVGLKDLVLIPQSSLLEWVYDPDKPSVLRGIKQLPATPTGIPMAGVIEIPMAKVALFRIQAEKDSPEGQSILRSAYRSYHFQTNLEVIEGISLERIGAGIPVISLPEGATTQAEAGTDSDEYAAKQVVRKVKMDEQGGIVEPFGWHFRIASPEKALRPELFDLAIKRHRSNLLISVLAVFLELGTARVGSFALAKVGRSHFENAFEGMVCSVEETFNNKVVPLLFELNGVTDEKLPKLSHSALGGEALESVLDGIERLANLGLLDTGDTTLRDHVRALLRIPAGSTVVEREAGRFAPDGVKP